MYVTVGSATNATPETRSRAAPPSTSTTPTAAGIACSPAACAIPVGLAYFPGTNTLWTAVNERDHLGDDLVPDFITSVGDGAFYGWPYSYIGKNVDPDGDAEAARSRREGDRARRAAAVALGGARVDLLHRLAVPRRVPEQRVRRAARIDQPIEARPATPSSACRFATASRPGRPKTFLSGFIARDDDEKQAWGRPVGLLQLPDGSLLVSDDGGNRVWRVS